MAGPIAEAFVNVRAQTTGFQGDVSRGVTSAFRGVGRTVAGLAATYGVGQLFQESITSASDLTESLNAVSVSFGDLGADAVGQLNTIGESAATNMGLTQTQFNEAAVRFNAFSRAIASASGTDVIDTLEQITGRATDFASVMNLDVAEAQRLFQSGLAGETEPLRRFGIDISAARVEAYALSEGIASTYEELDESQKQMIRWQLILEQTGQMQGDFANTSEMLANSMRIAKAQVAELGISFGTGLLPGLQTALTGINDFLPSMEATITNLGTAVGGALTPIFETIGPAFNAVFTNLAPVIENLGGVIGALAPVVTPLINLFGTFARLFSGTLMAVFSAFAPVLETVGFFIQMLADTLLTSLTPVIFELVPIFTELAGVFNDALLDILPIILDLIKELAPSIVDLAEAVVPLIELLVDGLVFALETLEPILPEIVKGFVAFKIAFAALNIVMRANPVILVATALAALAFGLKTLYDRSETFRNAVDSLWQSMQRLWDVVSNKVVAVWQNSLLPIFREFQPVIDGVKAAISSVVEAFKSLLQGDFSGAFARIKEAFLLLWQGIADVDWSRVGQLIVDALSSALSLAWDGLQSVGSLLGDVVGKFVNLFQSVDWGAVGATIVDALGAAVSAVWSGLGTVAGWFGNLLGKFTAWVASVNWVAVGSAILNALSLAVGVAWSGLASVASWFGDLLGKFTAWINSVDWNAVGKSLVNGLSIGAAVAWSGLRSVGAWFGGILGKFTAWIGTVDWATIGGAIVNALGLAVAVAFQGIGSAASWLGDMVTRLSDWISSVDWDSVGTQIGAWVGELPGKLIGWIADAFSSGGGDGGGGGGGTQWTEVATTLLNGLGSAIFALGVTLPLAILQALAQLGLGIVTELGKKLLEAVTGDNPVANFFKELPGNFVDWVGDMASAGLQIASDFLLSVVQGFQELGDRGGVGGFISEIFGDLFHLDQVEDAIRPGARQIREAFNDAFSKAEDGINAGLIVEQLYSEALPAINEVGREAGTQFSEAIAAALADGQITADELVDLEALANDLLTGATDAGETVAAGFATGASGVDVGVFAREWRTKIDAGFKKDVYPAFNNAPTEFNRQVARNAPTALKSSGTSLITGLKSGVDSSLVQIRTQMAGLSLQFGVWLGNLSRVFVTSGYQLMNGLATGIRAGVLPISVTLAGYRTAFSQYLGNLSNVFVSAGLSLMTGLVTGMRLGFISVASFIARIPGSIHAPNMGSALISSGTSLMNGLYAGIFIGWLRVQQLLRAITNAIPSFKGPEDVDRQLLEPAGLAIMEGFRAGLADGWRQTQSQLSGFTSSLQSSGGLGVGELSAAVSGASRSDGDVNVVIGAPQVNFQGALPTDEQARMVGAQVGRGIQSELAKSRIRGIARTAGS